jgi:CRISPR-associated protein Csd1
MLLKHLYDFAYSPKRNLLADDAFEARVIRYVIALHSDGGLAGVQDISPDGKRGKEFPAVPQTARVKKGKVAEFLVDGIDSIFGLSPDPSKPKNADMLRAKFDDFWSQIEQASKITNHAGLSAVLNFKPQFGVSPGFLRQDGNKWLVRTASGAEVRLAGDSFTFRIDSDLLLEDEARIKPYWRKVFAQTIAEQEQESELGLCLITGKAGGPIARTHTPRISKIPGVGIDGTIVSFEKSAPAFSSYGKVQSNNAPCSVAATRAYSKALQFLVDQVDHHVLIGKTKLCFWTKDQVLEGGFFARLLNQPQPDEVRKFLVSPWAGIPREIAHRDQFFAVTVAGNNSRIVIRHWLQQPLDQAIENFHDWFADLELRVPPKPEPKAGKNKKPSGKAATFHPLSVYWLACTTVRESKDLPTEVPVQLYRAALEHTAPSISLIKPILDQLHSKLMREENYHMPYDQSRFALLKLILNRNRRSAAMEIQPELTADTNDPAYNSGRLLAILAAAQDKAHEYGLKGPGVAERYFGTASVSPASVFPLLLRLNRHHLDKIAKSERFHGHERFIQQQMESVLVLFKPEESGAPPAFPRTLDLQSQGRFAIGFYQQSAADQAARQPRIKDESPNQQPEIQQPE